MISVRESESGDTALLLLAYGADVNRRDKVWVIGYEFKCSFCGRDDILMEGMILFKLLMLISLHVPLFECKGGLCSICITLLNAFVSS